MKLIYSILIFVILSAFTFLLLRRQRIKKNLQNLNYSEEGRNIALSISNCKKLHKELAKMAHPDRFKEDKKELADKLIQEINSAKYDYKKLLILKSEVELFLNTR